MPVVGNYNGGALLNNFDNPKHLIRTFFMTKDQEMSHKN
jgi:hypothetical protein